MRGWRTGWRVWGQIRPSKFELQSGLWQKRLRKLAALVACMFLVTGAVAFGYYWDNTPQRPLQKTAVTVKTPSVHQPVTPPPIVPDSWAPLPGDMNAVINRQTALSASATVVNLDTGKEYDAGNYTQTYEAASTSKLVAVFDYIHQVELGKASLTQTIGDDQAQDIIRRMIVNSDNDAWDELNGYLRLSGEQKYLNSIGVAGKMTPDNIQFSTPAMAKLLQLLYQGKLMNTGHQAMIYGYMAHTTMNKLIPAAVPAGAMVYHKYGEIDGVLHDAAIIQYQGHNFALVIYTNNPANTMGLYSAQVQLIHAITTVVCTDIAKG